MSLDRRIKRLERLAAMPGGRCVLCADRREYAIYYSNDAGLPGVESRPPERCACGWGPKVIEIVYEP